MKPREKSKKEVVSNRLEAEKKFLDNILEFADSLRKQGYTEEDILNLVKKPGEEILKSVKKKEPDGIPVSIFANDELSSLETIVKFLKENKRLRFSEIASLLNRDQRNVWTTYSKSVKKKKEQFVVSESKYYIPVEIFKDRSLGVLENICLHLKDEYKLSFHEIAVLLRRNDRTVWTSCSKDRGKKKL